MQTGQRTSQCIYKEIIYKRYYKKCREFLTSTSRYNFLLDHAIELAKETKARFRLDGPSTRLVETGLNKQRSMTTTYSSLYDPVTLSVK